MNLTGVLINVATQVVPGLIGALIAFLWFVRRGPNLGVSPGWGGLAALALLAVPSVCEALVSVFRLTRVLAVRASLPSLLLSSLLPALILFVIGLIVVLSSFFQHQDPLRRHLAASVLIGYLARELAYVVFLLVYWVLSRLGLAVPF